MFNALIEMAFKRAQENGDMDDLKGAGKPIEPSTLRADPFAHAMQESGAMTPFGAVQRKIETLREQLADETDPIKRRAIQTEISALETRKAIEMEMWKRY